MFATPRNTVDSERIWLICAVRGPGWPYACPDATERDDQGGERRRRVALEAPRRAHARQLAQEQPEVEAADVNEQPLENVGVSPQMHAAHPARLVEMRVGAFQSLTPLPQQPLPRTPRIRRRLAYTASRVAALRVQLRRPRSGSDT